MSSISPVLDAFAGGAAAGDPDRAEVIQREAEAAAVTLDEKEMLFRALTAASRAGSRATGETPRSRLLTNGESAFAEVTSFKQAPEPDAKSAVDALVELLHLAADNLGPMPAGGIGHVKGDPIAPPPSVESVEPGPKMQQELAGRAGRVVGLAAAIGKADPAAEVRALNDGCPVCGAPVAVSGGSHQQLAPGTGHPRFESGKCDTGHQLNRPEGTIGQWKALESGEAWGADPFREGDD